MKKTGDLGIGIVGCGRIADLQILGYLAHPRDFAVAVCDANGEVAERRGKEWNALRCYTKIEDLLADEEVDAVEILTPHDLHVAHTLAALAAGKHVSLQKPPTRTMAEFDELSCAAIAAGRTLRVFENFAYYPLRRLARRPTVSRAAPPSRAPPHRGGSRRHTAQREGEDGSREPRRRMGGSYAIAGVARGSRAMRRRRRHVRPRLSLLSYGTVSDAGGRDRARARVHPLDTHRRARVDRRTRARVVEVRRRFAGVRRNAGVTPAKGAPAFLAGRRSGSRTHGRRRAHALPGWLSRGADERPP